MMLGGESMPGTGLRWVVAGLALTMTFVCAGPAYAQSSAATVYHQIDGRLHTRSGQAAPNIHVRLLREATRRPVGETFSRSRGEFEFNYVPEGEYLIETYETAELEASSTSFQVRPLPRERPAVLHVEIDIAFKPPPSRPAPGVLAADVDLLVPKEALKHYRAGTKALAESDSARAVAKFQEAIKVYPEYYAARLDLGRELRRQKRFKEAEEALVQLRQIAPKRAEPLVEHALVLLELQRRTEAATELRTALQMEEVNWAAHFYLGWALIEEQSDVAEAHFKRSIELDEQKAARAHLALARLADAKGERELAIKHLNAYLVLVPNGTEADIARSLVERLRKTRQESSGSSKP
jgi:tetratricopeptide (TPR) repeat protein